MDQYVILLLSACLATCLGQYPGQTSYVAPNPYLHSQDSYITAKPYAANPYPQLQTYPSKSASNQYDVFQHSYTTAKPYIDNPYPNSQAYPFNPVSNQHDVSHDSYIKANPFVGNPDTYPTGVQRHPSYTSSNSVSRASYPISKSNAVNDQTVYDDFDLIPKQHSAFTSFNTYPSSQNSYPAVIPNLESTYISGQYTNQEPRQYPNHRTSQDPYQQLNQYPDTQPNPYRQSIGTSQGSEIVNSGKGFTSLESQDGSEEYTHSGAPGSDYYAESGSPHYSSVLKAYGYSEDPCKNGVKSYPVTGVCFAYFTCDYQRGKFGGVTWHDCGAGYRYDSKNGCVHDSSCQSACPAHIKPSSNPFKFYLGGYETYCDKGTFFDARHCTCAHYGNSPRKVRVLWYKKTA